MHFRDIECARGAGSPSAEVRPPLRHALLVALGLLLVPAAALAAEGPGKSGPSDVLVLAQVLVLLFVGRALGEVMQRIAAPMVGGMISAPLLSMFVIPAAYLLLRRRRERTAPHATLGEAAAWARRKSPPA